MKTNNMWRRIVRLIVALLLIPNVCWGGIYFNGTNEKMSATDANFLDDSVTATVYAVIKSDGTQQGQILGQWSGTQASWIFYVTSTEQISLATSDASCSNSMGNPTTINAITTGWHVVIAVKSGGTASTTDLKYYVDGTEITGRSGGWNINDYSVIKNCAVACNIGLDGDSANDFAGIISEAAVWKVALTASEIGLLSNPKIKGIATQVRPASMTGYWLLDEQEAGTSANTDTAIDYSNSGRTMTGTGGSWRGEDYLSYPAEIIGSQ